MNERVFGKGYADHYDHLYGDKDYEAECDLIERVFQQHADRPVETILDLGCGTGGHAIPLAHRGYRVTGVDRSSEMLFLAAEKIAKEPVAPGGGAPVFVHSDLLTLDMGRTFDAVLMMFAVLGYQLSNEEVLRALRTVRGHLNPGGLFVCDVWYGPAVLAIRPSERVKVIPTEDGKIIRAASGSLDPFRHLCEVRYRVWRLSGRQLLSETEESHQVRYFFPQELSLFCSCSAMQTLDLRAFTNPDALPDESTWNSLLVSKACE
jgi:SAM-dependent methyltransferase